jgi:pSer/pThr/pTyr-binding forkhead associated (FHA) protein
MPRVTITVLEESPQPYRFDLNREVVNIGRNHENDIVVDCGSVSGNHAEMHRVEGGYALIDVESTNGIKIDGIRHKKVILDSGMVVKLGNVEFGFTLSEDELFELASEVQLVELPLTGSDDHDSKKPISKTADKNEDEFDNLKVSEESENPDKAKKRVRSERTEKREQQDEYSESKVATIGSGFLLFALIAVAGAFFYGSNARHQKDTGESLPKAFFNKEDVKNDAPADVEDTTH